jgi:prephenate dehydrogenase
MDDGFSGFKIGIAGLGLIGGSLALAFKRAGLTVYGYDIDKDTIKMALKTNAVDYGSEQASVLFDCDCIFVALYPDDIVEFVERNAADFKKGEVVIDCCGIKTHVCDKLFEAADGAEFSFIGGHPMAGTEHNGFAASSVSLFDGASFILTPREGESPALLKTISDLLYAAGFGDVVVTTPRHHDRMIAYTSQLPHVIACSYVMSPSCPQHSGYSAGSFKDVARVAHINPLLWPELFAGNSEALCEEIDTLIANMLLIREAAANGDRDRLTAILKKSREIKDNFT